MQHFNAALRFTIPTISVFYFAGVHAEKFSSKIVVIVDGGIKTPQLLEAICDAISGGVSARAACLEIGISQWVLWEWLATDRAFAQQYAREAMGRIFLNGRNH